jgi:succinoglycan biosynthesis transport protein ExoP
MTNTNNENLIHSSDFKEEVIDLRDYWNVIRRRQRSIGLTTFLIVVLSALIAFSMDPIYKSTVTLLIETEDAKVVSIEEVYAGGQQSIEYLNTQFEVIKSQALARKVIEVLDLTRHPYFLPELDESGNEVSWRSTLLKVFPESVSTWFESQPESGIKTSAEFTPEELRIRELLGDLSKMMSVEPLRNTQLVQISFEASDNNLAALMANEMAQVYIKDQLDARLGMTSQANSWLSERLSDIREKLKTSEAALQSYKEREDLIEAGGVTGLILEQLQELNQDLILVQRNLSSLEAAREQIRQVKTDQYQDYLSIPAVLEDNLVSELIQDESEAAQALHSLSQRYGYKHPKIISAKAALGTVSDALKKHVLNVVNGIERQYQLVRSAEASAQRALTNTRQELNIINRKEHQLGILEREVIANRQLYNLFLNRIKETNESIGIDQANARIVDTALPAINPVKPKKRLIILIAGFLGLGFGVLLAFLFEHLDNTLKTAVDIEERLKLAVLGVLPKVVDKADDLWKMVKTDNHSNFSEGIRTIRTGMILSRLDNPHKTVMVTSCLPGEGKTVVASNTAINLSEMHKVLLIDADLRKPSIGPLFGLKPDANGLTELLSKPLPKKVTSSSRSIHRYGESGLHIMPSGCIPPNPLDLISSTAFKRLLSNLAGSFDHIIIDSPPVLPVSDAQLIAAMVSGVTKGSGVIYVMKASSTPIPLINEGLNRLRQANMQIIGGVLNQFDAEKHAQYGGYMYAGGYYAGSYGEKS